MIQSIPEKVIFKTFKPQSFIEIEKSFSFQILWIIGGNAQLILDTKNLKINEGDFLVLMGENTFKINSFNQGEISYISLSVDYLQLEARHFSIDLFKLFIKNSASKILKVEKQNLENIDVLKKMIFETHQQSLVEKQIFISLLNTILLLLIKSNHNFVSVPDKYLERIHDFFLLIFKHSKSEKRVGFYADKLSITPKRLNQILQTYTNHSASYFIQEHSIMEAKRYLTFGNLNISQIAAELGYEDVAYFSRFFKKWAHVSPEKYRKEKHFQ